MLGFNLKGSIPAGLAGKGAEVGFSAKTFPRRSIHTEISPLRFASVEMTKGSVADWRDLRFFRCTSAYGDQGAVEKPKVVTLW
jgi:hypothetical protein